MTRATGPIICDQFSSQNKIDFFLFLPVLRDRIVTVLVGQSSASTLSVEFLAGKESKEPKPERNRDRKMKAVADVLLSPTGIKKVTMR